MEFEDFVKTEPELMEIAEVLLTLATQSHTSVYRYKQTLYDSIYVDRGRKNINRCGLISTYNAEDIYNQVFSSVRGEEVFPYNIQQFEEWRRRSETPYIFTHKGNPLPSEKNIDYRNIPTNYDRWDDDLLAFTREYKNERITRDFGVEQRVIVNSSGGMIIESRSFFTIYYRQGYEPNMITRTLGAYVSTDEEVKSLPKLIGYLPDPTPNRSISSSRTFTDAFARLFDVSHQVEYADLDSAGLSNELTNNVIMINGVPIHEIFGHQFEEPIHPLQVGQQSLFPMGKNVQNPNPVLRDNPRQKIEGLDVLGSYYYDSYGRPSREKININNSHVCEHLGSEYIDLKNLHTYLGIEKSTSYGNARQGDDGSFPLPRMSCTVLEGNEENIDWCGKLVMVPFHGHVLDGNFFKVMSSECYYIDANGIPKRVGPLEGSRAIYDAMIGMHILPGQSHHVGSCSKPNVLDDSGYTDVIVSFLTNHQMWEHLTLRPL